MEKNSIAKTFKYLCERDKVTLTEISLETGLNQGTLSKIMVKDTNRIDLEILEKLANFFEEDISIFCGLEQYKKVDRLTDDEKSLMETYRSLSKEGQDEILHSAGIIARVKDFEKKKR